ncbi:hypothetical protein AJ87_09505 [Rhizobium yanglingense]|nr:hypothetical protein AJ87_09505 [Rhizobium yanglingense]
MHIEAKANHIGRSIDPMTRAVSISLHTSTIFIAAQKARFPPVLNTSGIEAAMALLEGGSTALAFSSGMAAITAVFEGHATEGRIVVPVFRDPLAH